MIMDCEVQCEPEIEALHKRPENWKLTWKNWGSDKEDDDQGGKIKTARSMEYTEVMQGGQVRMATEI